MCCSICGGFLRFLGTLGNLSWFRCEDCGYETCTDHQTYEPEGE